MTRTATEAQIQRAITFTVPLVPPSVNHYKMRTRKGVTFVSDEAKAFKQAVASCAGGRVVNAKQCLVAFNVYLGAKQKGDVDNFAKCVLDGLVEAGVIESDARVVRLVIGKFRDRENPRTTICVEAAL